MLWWILLSAVVTAVAARHFWRLYSHPYNLLIRQAANMDWVAAGAIPYPDGIKNMRLRRAGMLAEVSFKQLNVRLLEPQVEEPFKDFLAIERWIGARSNNDAAHSTQSSTVITNERLNQGDYFERVDGLLAAKGLRDEFMLLQGWDREFGEASARLCAVGERTQESPIVMAAFIAESMEYHKKSRDVALSYLARLESGFKAKLAHPDWAAELEAEQRKKNELELTDNEPNDLHDTLDEIVGQAFEFVTSNCHANDKGKSYADFRLQAELVAYVASFNARRNAKMDIHPSEWNTFKAGVENRMLTLRDDGHQRSGLVNTPDGGQAFASFVSTYWKRMDDLEALLESPGMSALAQRLVQEEGFGPCSAREMAHFIQELSEDARRSLLPKIVSLFQ